MSARCDVAILGAGMAGLTAAHELAPRFDVVVIDKARGVGGRVATRRIGDATFDHGAQFLTTHSDEFAGIVAEWEAAGVVRTWFDSRIGPAGVTADTDGRSDGHPRWCGAASMNSIAKHLASDLDVRRSTRASAIEACNDGWRVQIDEDGPIEARAIVLTAPVAQSLALLDAGATELTAPDRSALERIRYDPCIAVMATLDGPSGLPDPGAIDPDDGPIDWMADNLTKGISALPAVTIHATPAYSSAHWDDADDAIVSELIDAAALASDVLGGSAQVHRWRYATPTVLHPEAFLLAAGARPLVFAGDAFGGAKVEGAVLSGRAAGRALGAGLGASGPPG